SDCMSDTTSNIIIQELRKLQKKIDRIATATVVKDKELSSYRDQNEKENFPDEISFENGPNLLDSNGKDFRDYSIGVLKKLYTKEELKSSILPSSTAHIYAKKQLDPKRFKF
ncbi:unnamed protein product, partial [Didymodactylos carnosus]